MNFLLVLALNTYIYVEASQPKKEKKNDLARSRESAVHLSRSYSPSILFSFGSLGVKGESIYFYISSYLEIKEYYCYFHRELNKLGELDSQKKKKKLGELIEKLN